MCHCILRWGKNGVTENFCKKLRCMIHFNVILIALKCQMVFIKIKLMELFDSEIAISEPGYSKSTETRTASELPVTTLTRL